MSQIYTDEFQREYVQPKGLNTEPKTMLTVETGGVIHELRRIDSKDGASKSIEDDFSNDELEERFNWTDGKYNEMYEMNYQKRIKTEGVR